MRLILGAAQLDRIIGHATGQLALGGALMSLGLLLPGGVGLGLTGFMLLSGGIYAKALRRWRTEPGLWMLAAFLTLMLGGGWAFFEWSIVQNLLAAGRPNLARPRTDWRMYAFALDSSLAMFLFGQTAWFCASVAVRNRARTNHWHPGPPVGGA